MFMLRIPNPVRNWYGDREENPSALGTLLVLGLITATGYGVYRYVEGQKTPTAGGATCEVTFTEQSLRSPAVLQKLLVWGPKWDAKRDQPARDAAISLMQDVLAPQCKWSPTTVATIHRADGTTTTWAEILNYFGDDKLADVDDEFLGIIVGFKQGLPTPLSPTTPIVY
jgi:hypothetical protein